MGVEGLLNISGFKDDIINVLMEEFLGVEIEIVMLFAFSKELCFQAVFSFTEILADLEVL